MIMVAIPLALAVSPFLLSTPHVEGAHSTTFACGGAIHNDVTLTANVVCPAGFVPPGSNGGRTTVIGADNIVIDGAGFTFD